MRVLKMVFLALVMVAAALPLAAGDQPSSLDQVVDRIISRESAMMTSMRQYISWAERSSPRASSCVP